MIIFTPAQTKVSLTTSVEELLGLLNDVIIKLERY